jgi:hypothetical protein
MKTRFSSSVFVASATLTLAGSAFAQDAIAPLPPESNPAPAPAAAPAAPAAASASDAEAEALAAALGSGSDDANAAVADVQEFKLNIYGFADFLYSATLNDFTLASPYSSFMVGNLNLYVGAELGSGWRTLSEVRFTYLPNGNVPLGGGTRQDTTANDPANLGQPTVKWGGIQIERAWLEYTAHPLLTIQAGQWLTPYGIWNVDHGSPVIIGVRRPFVVNAQFLPERQTGLQIYGSYLAGTTEVKYNLGLSNGRGPVDTYQDFDKNKGFTARLSVSNDLPIGNITLGGTYYRGRYTDRTQGFAADENGAFMTTYTATAVYDEMALAADLRWVWEDFSLQGEFISHDVVYPREELRPAPFPSATHPPGFTADTRSNAWYLMAAYRLPWLNIMPFFGGESYKPNQSGFSNATAIWGGLNVRPIPRVVLKAQYTQSFWLEPEEFAIHGDQGLKALDLQAAWSF